jgi:hypothetical protein
MAIFENYGKVFLLRGYFFNISQQDEIIRERTEGI